MKEQIYNFLKSGMNRTMVAAVSTMIILSSLSFCAQAQTVPVLQLGYMEHALYLTIVNGDRSGNVICLQNKAESTDGLPKGWGIYTCNDVNTPLQWSICYMNIEKQSIMCGTRDQLNAV